MNEDDKKLEPVTDVGLAASCSHRCIHRRVKNDSGAGANAGSSVDMTFVATDPLSELVWSPQKGLSLKCADCSSGNRKPSILWGVGPSSVVLPPVSITAGSFSSNKPIEVDNIVAYDIEFQMNSDVGVRDTLARCPTNDTANMPVSGSSHEHQTSEDEYFPGNSGHVEAMNTVTGLCVQLMNQNNDLKDYREEGISGPNNMPAVGVANATEYNLPNLLDDLKPDMAQIEPSPKDPADGGGDIGCGNQTSRMEVVMTSDVHTKDECEAYDTPVKSLTATHRRHEESALFMEKQNEDKMEAIESSDVPPTEKLESTADNDLQTLISEKAFAVANRIVASEFANEGKRSSQQEEEMHPEKAVPSKHSPTNSRVQKDCRKDKEKAMSDGYINGRMSREYEDSHESVESCNGTGLFSTGKKRWNFEQQLILGSKRVKKEIQEAPECPSLIKHDSSFMNWISNMMKGFLQSKVDEAPSTALTLGDPNNDHESPDPNFIASSRNQDPGCKAIGFQSIFQSIYCPKSRVQEAKTSNENYETEAELPDKIIDIDATPVGCHGENVSHCKQFLLSNEKKKQSTFGNSVNLGTEPKIPCLNIVANQERNKTNSAENKNSWNLATNKDKEGTSSFSSLGKCKLNENMDSEPISAGMAAQSFGNRNDSLRNLWITRFAPNISGSSVNLNHHNLSIGGGPECSIDCRKVVPCSQYQVSSHNGLKIAETRQHSSDDPINVMGNDTEASIGFGGIKSRDDLYKTNTILPSPRINNSEAMASLFARRLDALKHIMPSNIAQSAGSATTNCSFCGRKGHHLQDCSEVTESELEDLLQNVDTYHGTEQASFCIRCFQLDHWAVTCPKASAKRFQQTECGASLATHCIPNRKQHNSEIEEDPKLFHGKKTELQTTGLSTVCRGDNCATGAHQKLNYGLDEMTAADKKRFNEESTMKDMVFSSGENKMKRSQVTPLGNFCNMQTLDVPKGIFDVVKMLRLSRMDILKWMTLQMSLSLLDGFFLRLRLGKWEKGVRGTAYYVACITEAHRQNSTEDSRKAISVVVGGIKCLVESQYISNHDFLEDELSAWWSATKMSGDKIPSEEDLRLKLKERKMLGL